MPGRSARPIRSVPFVQRHGADLVHEPEWAIALLVLDGSHRTVLPRCPGRYIGDPPFSGFPKMAIFRGPQRLARLTMSASSRFAAFVPIGQRQIT